MDAVSQADIVGAGRDEPLIDPVVAEVAFVGDVLVIVIGDGIIGTCVDAGLTTGTQVVIHDDNAVIALADGFLRAYVGTGGIVAMAAQIHLKTKFQFSINPPGAVLCNGYQFDAVRRPIFMLAGHLAGFTAPAQVMVYFYFELGHDVCLYFFSNIEE